MRQLLKITSMFIFALAFMAGTAFAQQDGDNEATVNQTGDANEAMVLQYGVPSQGTPGPSKTFLDQVNGSEADVRQQGGSTTEGPQILTGFGGDNAFQKNGELDLVQFGADDMVRLDQVGGEATLWQGGTNHLIELKQGNGSEATVIQSKKEPSPTSSNNQKAFLYQSANDFADVVQGEFGGDNNLLYLDQNNGSNSATVEQLGKGFAKDPGEGSRNNVARLVQYGGADAEVYQDGTENLLSGYGSGDKFVTQEQGSFLSLNQSGDDNRTSIDQENGRQIARLDQSGGSTAEVEQTGGQGTVANRLSGTTAKFSSATQQKGSYLGLKQSGNNNWTAIDQTSGHQVARLDQSGGSVAEVEQKGGSNGPVSNRLSGTKLINNGTAVAPAQNTFATQNNSELDLLQNGNNNTAAIDQLTVGNTATVTQNGNTNTAVIYQQ